MNRGSPDKPLQRARSGAASMRPRFMNRGSDPKGLRISTIIKASMRPRFMNRGSPAAIGGESFHGGRFNEAPIHESGK